MHLRRNKIEKIEEELPDLPSLLSLNLRSNKLSTMDDVYRLFKFEKCLNINIINSPIELNFSSMNVLIS